MADFNTRPINLKRSNSYDLGAIQMSSNYDSIHSLKDSNNHDGRQNREQAEGLKQRHHSTSSFTNLKTRKNLSIAGKELLKQAFSLPLHCGVSSSSSTQNKLDSLKTLSKAKFKKKTLKNNPFGAFSDSDSSSESSSQVSSVEAQPIINKREKFIPINENDGDWSVVKERKERTSNEYVRPKYPWEYPEDEYEDYGSVLDLANLQRDAVDGRSFGRSKKSNQFKVAQQRHYAIKKRNRQRGL